MTINFYDILYVLGIWILFFYIQGECQEWEICRLGIKPVQRQPVQVDTVQVDTVIQEVGGGVYEIKN